jgi:hypothetical protein
MDVVVVEKDVSAPLGARRPQTIYRNMALMATINASLVASALTPMTTL